MATPAPPGGVCTALSLTNVLAALGTMGAAWKLSQRAVLLPEGTRHASSSAGCPTHGMPGDGSCPICQICSPGRCSLCRLERVVKCHEGMRSRGVERESEHYTEHIAAREEKRQDVEGLRMKLQKAEEELKEETERVGAPPRRERGSARLPVATLEASLQLRLRAPGQLTAALTRRARDSRPRQRQPRDLRAGPVRWCVRRCRGGEQPDR